MSKASIINCAKKIAQSQNVLANSPAEKNEKGQIILCAASCIALAALMENQDLDGIENFMNDVLLRDKNILLPEFFERAGLNGVAAKIILAENDAMDRTSRLEWFQKQNFHFIDKATKTLSS